MDNQVSMTQTIKDSFTQYAGAVIQSRALVDVRDCVKPSARQIYYSLYTDGFLSSKPFKKTLKAIGSAMRFYIHGDSSCEGILLRSSQPFSMRYPLVEVEGSFGTLTESGNWAAPRYTASRLSELANYLLEDTDKYSITEWADNYDDTEQYPMTLASKGFYNIVNGTSGIAVGIASSIPQFNLKEVNTAMCKLIDDPNTSFDDVYCQPDFATGGTIVNASEVKESLRKGCGSPCIIRADISYNEKENSLIVTSLPYAVYTNTICKEIEKIANIDSNPGIVDLLDLTGENVYVKIKLSKISNPEEVKQYLYQNTSLQNYYGINMMMLEDGRYPKMFGWKDALLAHIEHEKSVYVRGYQHKLEVLRYRFRILSALLAAIDRIDKVVEIIKKSASAAEAGQSLQELLSIEEFQAKAILDIKLSRLAKLEKDKLMADKNEVSKESNRIKEILESEELLKNEIKKELQKVSDLFGDKRRTKMVDLPKENRYTTSKKKNQKTEPYVVCLADNNMYLKAVPASQYREASANRISIETSSDKTINVFTALGKAYRIKVSSIKECLSADKGFIINSLVDFSNGDMIRFISTEDQDFDLIVVTKFGKVKRLSSSIFNGKIQNKKGSIYIKLSNGDQVISVKNVQQGKYVLMESDSEQLVIDATTIKVSGKQSGGRIGFKFAAKDPNKRLNIAVQFDKLGLFDSRLLDKVGTRGKKK